MRRLVPLLFFATLFLAACKQREGDGKGQNTAYYWRTEWRLDSVEQHFLHRYHINKVYCRYFDVVMSEGNTAAAPMPNATITFVQPVPQGLELVPTVFVTEACMHREWPGLASKLVKRIAQMNETNDIPAVREIQIDCDYTSRSRTRYYAFLEEVRQEARRHRWRLSTTIRLHQLRMPPPPADYGVLMLYNTGDPRQSDLRPSADGRLLEAGKNPVLDLRDVQPYLPRLAPYKLPLSAAYPVYSWQRTIGGVRIEHVVEADEILRVKHAVEKARPSLADTIVTYHLDRENIERYTTDTYEEIYRHR